MTSLISCDILSPPFLLRFLEYFTGKMTFPLEILRSIYLCIFHGCPCPFNIFMATCIIIYYGLLLVSDFKLTFLLFASFIIPMRIRRGYFCFLILSLLFIASSVSYADEDKTVVEVVRAGECARCGEHDLKTSQAFTGMYQSPSPPAPVYKKPVLPFPKLPPHPPLAPEDAPLPDRFLPPRHTPGGLRPVPPFAPDAP